MIPENNTLYIQINSRINRKQLNLCMSVVLKIAGSIAALFFLALCNSCCRSGPGGDATIVVYPKHHGRSITGLPNYPDTVYIKFNASDFPGPRPGDYDTYFVNRANEDRVSCNGLKCGKYYFYCAGFDNSINQRVTGGMAIRIKYADRKHETATDIAVTE